MSLRRVSWLLLIAALIGASCTLDPGQTPSRSICDGVGAELGGCDAEQPEFTQTECAAVGREFGALLDERTVGIITGPEGVDGEARSVRVKQAMVLVSVRANNHLREIGLHATCDVPEFLEAAEAEFSPELKRSVGEVLYDGAPPASYEEWLDELTRTIAVIDAEE